jgi:hypothetical protein
VTIHAYDHRGTVYYLQRTGDRDTYQIRVNPGRRSKLVREVESKVEWYDFVEGLKCTK